MARGSPIRCMPTKAAPVVPATAAREADTSLIIRAPAATAASATAALRVSIDTATPSDARASTTGITRRSSPATGTGPARGRVDSPPTSIQSAPCPTSVRPWAMAAWWSRKCPPSENESGVTLTTPMTRRPPLFPRGKLTSAGGHPRWSFGLLHNHVERQFCHGEKPGLPLAGADRLAPGDVVADRGDAQRVGPVGGGDGVEGGGLHLDGEHAVL